MDNESVSGKIALAIVVVGIPAAILAWVLSGKSKSSAVAVSDIENLKGAVTPEDEQTVLKMVDLFKKSSFGSDIGYIASILPNYMRGGANQPPVTEAYYTLNFNGSTVIPKSVSMMQAVWNGWLGTYVADVKANPVIPAVGKTQAQADEAAKLALDIARLWEAYKSKYATSFEDTFFICK